LNILVCIVPVQEIVDRIGELYALADCLRSPMISTIGKRIQIVKLDKQSLPIGILRAVAIHFEQVCNLLCQLGTDRQLQLCARPGTEHE
jgi:hypothetical protein